MNFDQEISDLISGKKDELVVKADQANAFREAWEICPQRYEIVGRARRQGVVVYHYRQSNQQG